MTLKIAVVAPIPSAMVTSAVMEKTGDLRSVRIAKPMSLRRKLMTLPVWKVDQPTYGGTGKCRLDTTLGRNDAVDDSLFPLPVCPSARSPVYPFHPFARSAQPQG